MCFPEFDSPSIFAALLDAENGGRFSLAPAESEWHRKQLYLPDSNILLTRFLADCGVAEVSDFMAITELGHAHDLVRRAKTVRGEIHWQMICDPRFDYGRANHRVETKTLGPRKHEVLFISEGPDKTALRLQAEAPIRIKNGAAVSDFKLRSDETAAFVLEEASESRGPRCAAPDYVADSFKQTMSF